MSQSVRHIGILGGSFDPVHAAHLALAQAACDQFHLDEVRFMPCAQQALKDHQPAPAADRCALLRFAVSEDARFTVDCREIFRGGRTYTYDTIQELKREEPDAQFWFICGMDSVCDFHRWHRARELVTCCNFIVFDRPGVKPPENPFDSRLLQHRLQGPLLDISSTEIRNAVAKGAIIRYPIGQLAECYLRDRNLYTYKES